MASEEESRKLTSRLRRLVGQAQALERVLAENDQAKFVGQLEAVIAASRAALGYFAETNLIGSDSSEDKELLRRIIRSGS